MTAPPLPDVPCVRVRLDYNLASAGEGGNRFYLRYTGSAPTAANCAALAAAIGSAWGTNIAPLTPVNYSLGEVDVLDIASSSGLSGQDTTVHSGTRSGSYLPASVCTNVEFNIARRYRGGKPRWFIPPGVQADLVSQDAWSASYIASVASGNAAFWAAVEALSIGAMGSLKHVNLSYYKGFTNITNSSGRERAVPTYRPTALHDDIVSYSVKAVVGSQRRRVRATTP